MVLPMMILPEFFNPFIQIILPKNHSINDFTHDDFTMILQSFHVNDFSQKTNLQMILAMMISPSIYTSINPAPAAAVA